MLIENELEHYIDIFSSMGESEYAQLEWLDNRELIIELAKLLGSDSYKANSTTSTVQSIMKQYRINQHMSERQRKVVIKHLVNN